MWTTIDGYVAGPEGEIDWILGDHQLAAYELAAVADRDTLLLGRSTYEDFAGYWPVAAESSEDGFERDHGRNMTSTRKVVASTTLTDRHGESPFSYYIYVIYARSYTIFKLLFSTQVI
jgi:dihydrofolate reductase